MLKIVWSYRIADVMAFQPAGKYNYWGSFSRTSTILQSEHWADDWQTGGALLECMSCMIERAASLCCTRLPTWSIASNCTRVCPSRQPCKRKGARTEQGEWVGPWDETRVGIDAVKSGRHLLLQLMMMMFWTTAAGVFVLLARRSIELCIHIADIDWL